MSECEYLISKFYFLTDRGIPTVKSVDVSVPFSIGKRKNKKIEFVLLSSFLEIVFGKKLNFNIVFDQNFLNSRSQRWSMKKKKVEKGCLFNFSFVSDWFLKERFVYLIFFFKFLSREKRDLLFSDGFFQVVFRDLEMGSFFLGDHKVNLGFKFYYNCKSQSKNNNQYFEYFLPFMSALYGLGFLPQIYRDEFEFLK